MGFDSDWIYCSNRQYATYTNLNGGTYIFRVKYSYGENAWSKKELRVKLVVVPPFYKSKWFIVTLILLLIFLAGFFHTSRMKYERDINLKLVTEVESRTKELQDALVKMAIQKTNLQESYHLLEQSQEAVANLQQRNAVYAIAITANHEINQPLMILRANLDMLELSIKEVDPKQERYCARINESIERIRVILEKLQQIEDIHFTEYTDETIMLDMDPEEDD